MEKVFRTIFYACALIGLVACFVNLRLPLAMALALITFIVGLMNMFFSFREECYNEFGLYVVATAAICIGYLKTVFLLF